MDIDGVLPGYGPEIGHRSFRMTLFDYFGCRNANTRGRANPTIMNNQFWLFQVSPAGVSASDAREMFPRPENPPTYPDEPIWCFTRNGATRTDLPDGRIVYIGGEYGDVGDVDFCIYNGKYSTDQYFCHPLPDPTELADVVVIEAPRASNPPPPLTAADIGIYG